MKNWLYIGDDLYNLDRFAKISCEKRGGKYCLIGYFEFSIQDFVILNCYDSKDECLKKADEIIKKICI